MIGAPGIWAGVNDSFLIARQREQEQMRLAGERQRQERAAWDFQTAQEDRQRQMRARAGAGQSVYGMVPPPVQPQAPQPPAPGQSSGPMMPPGMGAGQPPQMFSQPPVQPQPAQRGAPTPMPPPPYRALPTGGPQQPAQPQQSAGPGSPPPVVGAPQPGGGGLLMQMATRAKAAGVPPADFMDQIEALSPVLKNQMSEEMLALRGTIAEQNAYFKGAMLALQAGRDAERGRHNGVTEGQKGQQIEQSAERNRQRASAAANAKDWKEYRDGDTVYRDSANAGVTQRKVNGKWEDVDQLPAGATPASKAGAQSQAQAVRASLVKAGVTNSLARLDEIEKKFADMNTSLVFGQHSDGLVSATTNAAARGMLSARQQEADAGYASLVDEAMPVYTGGLRSSDSFRKFLISQLPQPLDKPSARKEKLRLFRANIEGTNRSFFNKFKSDPKMWGDGVTKDQFDAENPASGSGGWKVEKVE